MFYFFLFIGKQGEIVQLNLTRYAFSLPEVCILSRAH